MHTNNPQPALRASLFMRKLAVITDFVHQRLPEDFRRLLVQLMISAAAESNGATFDQEGMIFPCKVFQFVM